MCIRYPSQSQALRSSLEISHSSRSFQTLLGWSSCSLNRGVVAGGATDPAGGGSEGVLKKVDKLLNGEDDKRQGSGTGSGGRSLVHRHDQHRRSSRRDPDFAASRFSSDHGNTAFLALLVEQFASSFELLIGYYSEYLSNSISCLLETVLEFPCLDSVHQNCQFLLRRFVVLVT